MSLFFTILVWAIVSRVINCQTTTDENISEDNNTVIETNETDVPEFFTTETTSEIPLENELNSTFDNFSSPETTEFPSTIEFPSEKLPGPSLISSLFCSCDLLVDVCDVNCCCDQSCTNEDKNTFTECGMSHEEIHQEYCFKKDFIFINNTPYLKTKTSGNIFCIYTDNNQGRFTYKDVPSITEEKMFEKAQNEHQKYSFFRQKVDPALNESEFKVGSPIKIVFENEKTGFLTILTNLLTSGKCVGGNRVAYLTDSTVECYQKINNLRSDCANNAYLNPQIYFKNFSIIGSPIFRNENVSDDNLIPIVPYYCVNILKTNLKNCSNEGNFRPFYNNSTKVCEFAVKEIFYHIFHNGTRGIVSAEVHITLGNISDDGPNFYSKHKHSINFKKFKANVTGNSRMFFRVSGNPGYLTGAPVLAGKIVRDELSDEKTENKFRELVQLNSDPNKWLTIIDPRTSSECTSSTASVFRLPVTFKNDMMTGCSMKISLRNFTDANNNKCALLQNQMLEVLVGWNPPDVVGIFGNSQPTHLNQWVPILYENKPPISRLMPDTFKCTNIVREVRIFVLFAYAGSLNQPQAKILGIKFAFNKPSDFLVYCENNDCEDANVAMETSVEFIDISFPAEATFLDPPQIHLELPADFFYPFTSSVTLNIPTTFLIFTGFIVCVYNHI